MWAVGTLPAATAAECDGSRCRGKGAREGATAVGNIETIGPKISVSIEPLRRLEAHAATATGRTGRRAGRGRTAVTLNATQWLRVRDAGLEDAQA